LGGRKRPWSRGVGEGIEHGAEQDAGRVVALEPSKTCLACGAAVDAGDRFCARCGASMALRADASSSAAATLPNVPPAAEPRPQTKRAQRRLIPVLGLLGLASAGLIVLLALAWRSEQSGKHRAQKELATTRFELAASRAKLASTEASLVSTRRRLAGVQALSKRQAGILDQTAVVLRQVDPLLNDVDKLQQITGSIQSARDTFSADVGQLVDGLIAVGNDLIAESNNPYPDYSYINNTEIPNVNAELYTVRSDAGSLTSSDSEYASASGAFGNDANGFTRAVRRLQRELKALPPATP
jgi:hypothetical protein